MNGSWRGIFICYNCISIRNAVGNFFAARLTKEKMQRTKAKVKNIGAWRANLFFSFFLLPLFLSGCVTQFGKPTAEYRQKANDLINFGQFVEWPPSPFAGSKAPVVIGLLGGNPFGDELEKMAAKGNINGRPIVVERMTPFSNLKKCQILFIDRAVTSRLPLIFDSLGNAPVLTVGETDGFLKAGGMINFVTKNGNVRFEIAPARAQKTGLKMSSRLLTMAVRLAHTNRPSGH
jgi:hypothetical protein